MIKKLLLIVLFTLWFSSGSLAQEVILSDEFDAGAGLWGGWIDGTTTTVTYGVDTNSVLSGKNSYLLDVVEGGPDTYRIQRNANCPLLAGMLYTVSFLAVADRDVTINVLFEIAGDPYTKRLNELPEITTTPQVITYVMSSTENVPTNQLKLHFGGPNNDNYKIWIDNVVVTQEPDPALVKEWGKTSNGTAWPILNDSTTADGDAGIGNGVKPTAWATIRGGFGDVVTATTEKAIVVSGQMELVGGGSGSGYTHLRYALTYLDSTTLNNQYTDSALWVRNGAVNHYGYEWCPRSGTGTIANGAWGVGTVGVIKNGNWNSTNSNGGPALATIKQAPRNAEMVAGVYNWAISVQPLGDGTNEVRWYMVEQNNKYWFGGTVIDTSEVTAKFNGVCFGFNSDQNATQVNFMAVRVDLGEPIVVPDSSVGTLLC